jgi:dolichol-phosphate mannosyltransferase
VRRVAAALDGRLSWELIFVDDSDDATPDRVLEAATWAPVFLHHRPSGRRAGGLGGAVAEGLATARGRVIAVMDGDLQHPPEILPELVAPVISGEAHLAAGTRYDADGAATGLSGWWRVLVSRASRRATHALVPASRCLSDPMSGLFAIDPGVVAHGALRPCGFKILLEVAVRAPTPLHVANVAYRFADRCAGRSKARPVEVWRLGVQLWRQRSHPGGPAGARRRGHHSRLLNKARVARST